jgi:hypothetical protein
MNIMQLTERHRDEPGEVRTEGHRIMTGNSSVLEYVDVYRYAGGEVAALAVRRKGHETVQGERVVVVPWPGRSFVEVVAGHIGFERGTSCYTSDHSLNV